MTLEKNFNQFKKDFENYNKKEAEFKETFEKMLSELGEKPKLPRLELRSPDNLWKFQTVLLPDLETISLRIFHQKEGSAVEDWYTNFSVKFPIKYIPLVEELLDYYK